MNILLSLPQAVDSESNSPAMFRAVFGNKKEGGGKRGDKKSHRHQGKRKNYLYDKTMGCQHSNEPILHLWAGILMRFIPVCIMWMLSFCVSLLTMTCIRWLLHYLMAIFRFSPLP